MIKFKRTILLCVFPLLLVASVFYPIARSQDEIPEDYPTELAGMLGMFTKLDVAINTGTINSIMDTATIYIQVSQGGIPVDPENLTVILIYDDPSAWTDNPPMFFGEWELWDGEEPLDASRHVCNYTWVDINMDGEVGEDEKIHIPGLYTATISYGGFLPGDYLVWALAMAPLNLTEITGILGNETMGNMTIPMDMFSNMSRIGVGTTSFTVSNQLTDATLDIAVYTGTINSMMDTATVYMQVSRDGIPMDVDNLNLTMIYNDPSTWTDNPPMFFGYWELWRGEEPLDPTQHICNFTWADADMDGEIDEDEKIHIPGLYTATISYGGFLPGDYLLWAYADSTLDLQALMGDITLPENITMPEGVFGSTKAMGVGIGSFKVTHQLSEAKLDVAVHTGAINLMTETATIYVQVSQDGIPVDVDNLNITLIYDDPGNWTSEPSMFFGYWELWRGEEPLDPTQHICNFTWADADMDGEIDEDEKIHIPGLYTATVSYGGFLEGDYLIWAYAEATLNMQTLMGNMTLPDEMTLPSSFTTRTLIGVGTGDFTVSRALTEATLMIVEGLPGLLATQLIIDNIAEDVSVIRADVGELLTAAEFEYDETLKAQGVMIANIQLLTAITVISSLISLALLIKLLRKKPRTPSEIQP